MRFIVPIFTLLLMILAGCGENSSPVASVEGYQPQIVYPAAKIASHDRAMREFWRAYDQAKEVLRDLKRYIPKGTPRDPEGERHDTNIRKLRKDLDQANRRLDRAFRNVRNDASARAAMASFGEYMGSVLARLPKNVYLLIVINPCDLPWIGEYLCPYMPGQGISA
ncbi:MAG: hypothetical protein HY452_01150 [Parcubacteria group bacterium]|nr:hypothetical protein [Parcubacteria group bacterium]